MVSLWILLSTKHRLGPGAGWPPGLTIALALASAAVLPVALVSIVPAVCPFLRGGQQLPCLLLVLSDKRLSFFLLQLPICHLIHVVAFFRQREVGCKSKREACGPEKCIDGSDLIIKTITGRKRFPNSSASAQRSAGTLSVIGFL